MKNIVSIILITVSTFLFSYECNANEIPDIVSESYEEAVASGSLLTALEIWHREGHLKKFKGGDNYLWNVNFISEFERESYGNAVSYEHLLIKSPISEFQQIYTAFKYDVDRR